DTRSLPDRHIEHVEVWRLAQEFERVGGNPHDQIGMERRHELKPVAPGVTFRLLARRLKVLAVLDQIGAERPHRAVLLDRIAMRHVDRHRQAVAARRKSQTLAVIAPGGRYQTCGLRPLALEARSEEHTSE